MNTEVILKNGRTIMATVNRYAEDDSECSIRITVDGSERLAKLFFVDPDGGHRTTVCPARACGDCSDHVFLEHCYFRRTCDDMLYFEV